jgi:hypothetical protein
MQEVVGRRPEIALAVRCLSLLDQLELTLELLADEQKPDSELPPNVICFRPRGT